MTSEIVSPSISGAEARRAARNAGAIAAASLLSRGLQFGWQLILVPGLGPALFGIYGAVSAFIQIGTSIPNFGMSPIVIRDVARRPELAGKYLTSTLFLQTLLALAAYIGLNGFAALAGYDVTVRAFLAIASVNLIIDSLGNMGFDLLLAQERMLATSAVTVAHIVVMIGLAGVGLAAGYGLLGVYLGVMTAGVMRSAALWLLLVRGGVRPVWPFDRQIAIPLLLNGAPLALAAFLGLAYQHIDKLVTNRLIGNVETGHLALAFLIIFGVIELLNTTVITALYPLMSRAYGDGRSELFGFLVEKMTFFTLLICLPITLTISFFAADLTVPLFGEDFRPAASVLSILIWYALITMTGNTCVQALMVQNRQRWVLLIRGTGLGIHLALLFILLPRIGVMGAAVASVIAESIVLTLLLNTFRSTGWSARRLVTRAVRLVVVGAVTGGILAVFVMGGVHPVVAMAGGLLVYAAAVLAIRALGADDWDLLYRLTAAMPGGGLVRRWWRRDVAINW